MYPPRAPDDETRPTDRPRTWAGLAVATAAVAAVPFVLWAAANPAVGTLVVCGVLVLVAAGRAASRRTGDATTDSHETSTTARSVGPDGTPDQSAGPSDPTDADAPESARGGDAEAAHREVTGRDSSDVRTATAPPARSR